MKRLCFDTESNYYKPATSGIGNLDYHREWVRERAQLREIRWDCEIVYDQQADEYTEFVGGQSDELISLLATADELISHSGLRHDLLVLEHLHGVERVAPLFQIRHYDLFDICHWTSLDQLTGQYASKFASHGPEANGFLPRRLAKARFDVARTFAVWTALRLA